MTMLTDECTDHAAVPGQNFPKSLHTQINFYPEYFCLPLDGLLSILKLGQHMKYSHYSPESQNFYSFCTECLITRYFHFHTEYRTEHFSVRKSQAITESITTQKPGEKPYRWVLRDQMLLPRSFQGNAEKSCVSEPRPLQSHVRFWQTYILK